MIKRKLKITPIRLKKLIEYFVAGVTARAAAELSDVNRHTATKYFKIFREIIYSKTQLEGYFGGEIEIDESYFGGRRKGKRGRGSGGKIPVFGILKRNGMVYTKIIDNVQSKTLIPIITQKVLPDSIIYTDTFRSYDSLDVMDFKHYRINHSKEFASKRNHINGIENFWSQAKRHLRKFNGIPKKYFFLYIKECEWRFNFRSHKKMLKMFSQWVNAYLKNNLI